jgi:4-hydroxy-tetrahydrodipicolinate synthase
MSELCDCMHRGDLIGARDRHFRLLAWMRAAFIESNPLPVKAALTMMRKIENRLRLPLVPMDEKHSGAVRTALTVAGVSL